MAETSRDDLFRLTLDRVQRRLEAPSDEKPEARQRRLTGLVDALQALSRRSHNLATLIEFEAT